MYGYGSSQKHYRTMKVKNFMKNAVKGVKSFIVNKAVGNINPSSLVSSFVSGKTVNLGNTSGINKMLNKSPFEIKADRKSWKDDPLGFKHLQYPSDLTGQELGNWILFFTITSNIGKNPAENPDLQIARDMGLSPGTTSVDMENLVGKQSVDVDNIREMYKKRGIDIPRINKTNTVLRDVPSKDVVSGAIALYMPPDIKVSYGAGWGDEEMGISGDVAEAFKTIKAKNLGVLDSINEARRHGTGIAMQKGKQFVSAITEGAGLGDWAKLISKGMGLAVNNHAEMLYEGPGFREFTYDFKFWPRNPDETKKVLDIITMFKYHMHPGKNKNAWHRGRMFDYPSEFEIHYLHNSGVNTSLNKISRCALAKCDVSYVPSESSNFKTFEDHTPVTYGVSLTFKELEYMTKDKIKEGF